MKFLLLLSLSVNFAFANTQIDLEAAPPEWVIATAVQLIDDNTPEDQVKLVASAIENIGLSGINDEMRLTSNEFLFPRLKRLRRFIKRRMRKVKADPAYTAWLKESKSANQVDLKKISYSGTKPGFYYLNHVHTNLSKDNPSLKLLKLSPQATFKRVEHHLKSRRMKGVLAIADHDTDKGFDMVSHLQNDRLNALRSIEWGSPHMSLAGLKPKWDKLHLGRTFGGEEAIRQSKSSEAFRIINHPMQKKGFPNERWGDVEGIEVWNSILEGAPVTMFKFRKTQNRKGMIEWGRALAKGRRYTAVSGSDFHFRIPCLSARVLNYPVNYIPADDRTRVKEYLIKGQVSFLTRPSAPKLTLNARFEGQDWSPMGAEVKGTGSLEVKLFADFSDTRSNMGAACYKVINAFYKTMNFWRKDRWEVRFYNKRGEVIAKQKIFPKSYGRKKHFQATMIMPITGSDLVRVEIWELNSKRKSVDLIGATNPIYLNR